MRQPASKNRIGAVVGLCLTVVLAASASGAERVNKDGDNVAILGYDTVAYFTEGRPVPGTEKYEHVWHDARWHFSKAEHRDLFASDPQRYAPRYGGYCAGAMAAGWRVTVDPEAWVIVEDKLYLNYSKDFIEDFAADADSYIPKADENWKRLGQVN